MIHGTPRAVAAGCNCNLCTLVREQAPVPAAPSTTEVREHLDALVASGWTVPKLATHLGYHQNTLYGIRQGRTHQVTAEVAEDILSATPKEPSPAPAHTPCLHCARPTRTRGLCFRHWREAKEGVIPMPAQPRRIVSPETLAKVAASRRRHLDDVIDQVDGLVRSGVAVEVAVDRVGWGRSAAARALYRRGRMDLARPLQRVVTAARRAG